jgi:peptidoglycan/LPS O-acetylase OafA/YrhL
MVAKKIPSLDGLRALAILCVIASHSWHSGTARSLGHSGVTAFFVISGYLITELMLRERARAGDVSVKRFYQRRILRILPAYAIYLLVVAALAAAHIYRVDLWSWLAALTYTSSLMRGGLAWPVAHTWSLSVEEHFYLIWPLLFRWSRAKTAVGLLSVAILAAPAVRHYMGQWLNPSYSSPSQMGSIAAGCLLAFVLRRGVRPSMAWWIGAAAMFAMSCFGERAWRVALSDTERSIGFALLMAAIMNLSQRNPCYRVLNSAVMVQIGVLSYSLYLWQQPLTGNSIPIWVGAPLLAIVAFASYRFVESPFLRVKDRLEARRVRASDFAKQAQAPKAPSEPAVDMKT